MKPNNLIEKECVDLALVEARAHPKARSDNPAVRRYFMHGVSHPIGLDVQLTSCTPTTKFSRAGY